MVVEGGRPLTSSEMFFLFHFLKLSLHFFIGKITAAGGGKKM